MVGGNGVAATIALAVATRTGGGGAGTAPGWGTPVHLNGFVLTPSLGFSSKPTIVNDAGTYVLGSSGSVYAGVADNNGKTRSDAPGRTRTCNRAVMSRLL